MSEVPAPEMTQTSQKPNKLRQGFITLAETLLSSIADVFPECKSTESVLNIYRTIVKGNEFAEDEFIRKCQGLFKEHAKGIQEHDSEALFALVESLKYVRDIDIREKWEDPDFTQESRDHLWQYFSALKTYADLYTAVPPDVMGKIENVAGGLSQQLARGELDVSNMDLGKLGQSLMSDFSAEELANFEGSLPDIYQSLSEVASSLGGVGGAGVDLNSLMEQLARQTGEAGAPAGGVDMTQVLQQISSQIRPGDESNIDMGQMLQTMGPMLEAMRRTQNPSNPIQALPAPEEGSQSSKKKKKNKK